MTTDKPDTTASQNIQQCDISEAFVRDALAHLICAKPARVDSPLWRLRAVDVVVSHPHFPRMADAHMYALSCLLTSAILTHYQNCRHDLGLPPVENDETFVQTGQSLKQMMSQGSKELISWGLLYYRFVRVEFGYSPSLFSQCLHVDERTIRRYQAHGIRRLTEWLIGVEWVVRSGLSVAWPLDMQQPESFLDVFVFSSQAVQISLTAHV